jgi:hypothetical protein
MKLSRILFKAASTILTGEILASRNPKRIAKHAAHKAIYKNMRKILK